MAKYADIVKVEAPSSAIEGATVIVDVSVKNIGTSDQNLAVTAVFDSTSFPFQFDYLLVSPGQTVIFRGWFTMPSKNIGIKKSRLPKQTRSQQLLPSYFGSSAFFCLIGWKPG